MRCTFITCVQHNTVIIRIERDQTSSRTCSHNKALFQQDMHAKLTQKKWCDHSLTPANAPMTAPCRSVSFLAFAAAFAYPSRPAASSASFVALSVHDFCLSLGANSRILLLAIGCTCTGWKYGKHGMFSGGRVFSQSSSAHRLSSSKGSRPSFSSQSARASEIDCLRTKGR
jgi:hypothetical protein